jgi:hypothetical protein
LAQITRDETIFPDPESFVPERFAEGNTGPTPLNPRDFVFGAGRRICPGNHIIDATIFLLIASILATMDISKARDGQGNEIEPVIVRSGFQTKYVALLSRLMLVKLTLGISQVLPFKCSVTPRSDCALQLIETAVMFEDQ